MVFCSFGEIGSEEFLDELIVDLVSSEIGWMWRCKNVNSSRIEIEEEDRDPQRAGYIIGLEVRTAKIGGTSSGHCFIQ